MQCLPHPQRPLVQVDIAPAQPERLRHTLANGRMSAADLAAHLGVDAKTVQR
ncbi:hypothetical protein GCM10023225_12580 [Kineococcus glutinatus]|uniref:Homeodomain-like domain-containing protein n=1 Tax=Kineococcus glutinatus TaxID=1070872 RepID=A0ABP9HKA8_9ACTN